MEVHAVAADRIEIRELIQIAADAAELVIAAEICGICLRHADHGGVEHVTTVEHADLLQFPRRKIAEAAVIHRPQVIALVTEILQAEPNRLRIRDQRRAPVIEYL
jgi:hypothetical protein